MRWKRLVGLVIAFMLVAAACGSDSDGDETSSASDESSDSASDESSDENEGPVRTIDAVEVDNIVVDGDAEDWADVAGLDLTLEALSDESVESHPATVKVAHDSDNIYVLFQVDDDYNWTADDGHLSGSAAVEWGIDDAAEEHMGTEDDDRDTSLGMVDLWHWELECAAGELAGGAEAGPGADHDPGNDSGCNLDDEWATTPDDREDDNTSTGENSILGSWTHSDPIADSPGTWTFEFSRPLDTGDEQDAQFSIGSTSRLAVAYWDADETPDGWEPELHVQSANQGWIEVTLS